MSGKTQPSKETIEVSEKHIKLRFVLFLLALVIGITAFGIAFYQFANREPGYYEITATQDESAPTYANGFHLYCDFDGSSKEIKSDLRETELIYTESLGRIRRLLDAQNTYEGYTNLATLNAHLDEDVALPVELYTVLTETFRKGEEYGFYANDALLRGLWQSLLYLEDPSSFDPSVNETERERIEAIAALVNEPGAVTLTVVDTSNYVVRLSVSDALRQAIETYEVNVPVIDLGVLGEAYALKYVAGKLTAAEYTHGYLVTDSGLSVLLRDTANGELPICVLDDGVVYEAGTIAVKSGTACASLRTFDAEDVQGYYVIDGVRRHPYLCANAEPNRDLSAVWTVSDDIVDATWTALRLYYGEPGSAAERLAALPQNTQAVLVLLDNPHVLYATPALSDSLTPNESEGFAKAAA